VTKKSGPKSEISGRRKRVKNMPKYAGSEPLLRTANVKCHPNKKITSRNTEQGYVIYHV